MKEILIPFNQDMVKAILDGATQSRRICKVQPLHDDWELHRVIGDSERKGWRHFAAPGEVMMKRGVNCTKFFTPRFQPGDIMGVRERVRLGEWSDDTIFGGQGKAWFSYEVDNAQTGWIAYPKRLKPMKVGHCVPNGCFRELCRIKRKIKRVWYEQIRDINFFDFAAEGITGISMKHRRQRFSELWNSIYPGSWERNDWVECWEFEGETQ